MNLGEEVVHVQCKLKTSDMGIVLLLEKWIIRGGWLSRQRWARGEGMWRMMTFASNSVPEA